MTVDSNYSKWFICFDFPKTLNGIEMCVTVDLFRSIICRFNKRLHAFLVLNLHMLLFLRQTEMFNRFRLTIWTSSLTVSSPYFISAEFIFGHCCCSLVSLNSWTYNNWKYFMFYLYLSSFFVFISRYNVNIGFPLGRNNQNGILTWASPPHVSLLFESSLRCLNDKCRLGIEFTFIEIGIDARKCECSMCQLISLENGKRANGERAQIEKWMWMNENEWEFRANLRNRQTKRERVRERDRETEWQRQKVSSLCECSRVNQTEL